MTDNSSQSTLINSYEYRDFQVEIHRHSSGVLTLKLWSDYWGLHSNEEELEDSFTPEQAEEYANTVIDEIIFSWN